MPYKNVPLHHGNQTRVGNYDISIATLRHNASKVAWIRTLPRPDQSMSHPEVGCILQQDGKSYILTQSSAPLRKIISA